MTCCISLTVSTIFIILLIIFLNAKDAAKEKADKAENRSGSKEYIYIRDEEAGEIAGTNLDRFFIECVLSESTDFTKEKSVAKAKLLADKYNISYDNGIEEVYNRGLKEHEQIIEKMNADKLAEMRVEEEVEYTRLNRYSDLYGKNKTIAMLTDRMNELRQKADQLDRGAELLVRSTQQKERDWATWGGVASGIAGAGAGLATALDVQARNAQIRAQNEANMRAAMPAYMSVTGNASKNRANANAIQKQIDLVKEKLIADVPAQDVMQYLEVVNETIDVSETGSFKITATVKVKNPLFIFGDVNAIADGTLMAHVYDGDKIIGTAKMVLPVDGVSDKVGIVGVGLNGAEIGKDYSVKFTAHKLWLMEK